jgi:hypothetical protein
VKRKNGSKLVARDIVEDPRAFVDALKLMIREGERLLAQATDE